MLSMPGRSTVSLTKPEHFAGCTSQITGRGSRPRDCTGISAVTGTKAPGPASSGARYTAQIIGRGSRPRDCTRISITNRTRIP